MKSVVLTNRHRSITVPSRRPIHFSSRSRGGRAKPRLALFNRQASVNDMAKAHLCQILAALAGDQREIHRQAEPRRHCLRSISNRPVLLQLQTFALHDSFRRAGRGLGLFSMWPSTIASRKISDSTDRMVAAIVFCSGRSKTREIRRCGVLRFLSAPCRQAFPDDGNLAGAHFVCVLGQFSPLE